MLFLRLGKVKLFGIILLIFSLQLANVGIGMGASGTDVTKSVSDILLLDEPTKGIDASVKEKLAALIVGLSKHMTIVCVSHDLEFAAKISDRVAMIFNGQMESVDTMRNFFSNNLFYTTTINKIMRNIKDLSPQEVKKLCTKAKLKKLSEKELADLFGYVNSELFKLQGARGMDAALERKWWDAALLLINDEVVGRGLQMLYVGIEKGNEGKSAIELLNMEDEDFQVQAYSILDTLDLEALKRVECEIKKVLYSNKPLYEPYMEEVHQQMRKRMVILN